ncbi:MAG: DUF4143 domain-containing protein [Elusimicrobia bacterium]|jgi:hypothetical protein|nr:DUF4143 domain-containing protein [Elusimicrobiota bacterium]
MNPDGCPENPTHPLKGAIFETWVVSEIAKYFWHRGEEPPLSFWRDHKGEEIDLLVDYGDRLWPVEIKSAETIHGDFVKSIRRWENLKGNRNKGGGRYFWWARPPNPRRIFLSPMGRSLLACHENAVLV